MNKPESIFPAASRSSRAMRLAAVALLLGGAAVGAMAQYKIVGPDGKVTYTDKPPSPQDVHTSNGSSDTAGGSGAGFPYATRQAMGKYPVTLYITKSCPGCDSARQSLRQRGVPFNEYSVLTDTDYAAAQARFGANFGLPIITIGSQTLASYSPSDLQSYLDAAGYPAQARLAGYSWPSAVPLAPRSAPQVAAAPDDAASTPSPRPTPPSNPSGIQF